MSLHRVKQPEQDLITLNESDNLKTLSKSAAPTM